MHSVWLLCLPRSLEVQVSACTAQLDSAERQRSHWQVRLHVHVIIVNLLP